MNSQNKYLLWIMMVLSIVSGVKAQSVIPNLDSDSLVKKFVMQTNYTLKDFRWAYFDFTTGYEVSEFFSYGSEWKKPQRKKLTDSLKGEKWNKVDLNNDGKIDLVVNGVTKKPEGKQFENDYRLLVFMSSDTGYSQFSLVPRYLEHCPIYFNTIKVNQQSLIELTRVNNKDEDMLGYTLSRDTLVYMQNTFVNYNSRKVNMDFDSVFLYTTSSWVSNINYFSIDRKGNMSYKEVDFQRKDNQARFASLKKTELKAFVTLIDYVNPFSLKKNYTKPVHDVGTIHLILKYKDGSRFEIEDYGGYGTYSLKAIYDRIFYFIKNTPWK